MGEWAGGSASVQDEKARKKQNDKIKGPRLGLRLVRLVTSFGKCSVISEQVNFPISG